jgi:hypothetical protein
MSFSLILFFCLFACPGQKSRELTRYVLLLRQVFQTFACQRFDDGRYLLKADFSLSCRTSQHAKYRAWAGFCLLAYPVGVRREKKMNKYGVE